LSRTFGRWLRRSLAHLLFSKLFYELGEEAEIADLNADLLQASPALLIQEGAEEDLTSGVALLERDLLVLEVLPTLVRPYREEQGYGKCKASE
jgi:hypothetical protein